MKKLSILLIFFFASVSLYAQSPAEAVATKISQKLKDSLQLTENQRVHIYQINMELHQRKMEVRVAYAQNSALAREVQLIENTRDSLYKVALNEQQFLLYKQKKRFLVSNN